LKDVTTRLLHSLAHRGGLASTLLSKGANAYVRASKNLSYDMRRNGEYWLLDRLSALPVHIVFDVGANRGEYAFACVARLPSAKIHAFEVVPETYAKLIQTLAGEVRVVTNDFGLSDRAGELEIRYCPTQDGVSSIVGGKEIHDIAWETRQVHVETGDKYCASRSVDRINLLKIDVEGAEHLVLAGFDRMLRENRVDAVQFEFGMANIYTKVLLKDFWELFDSYGYVVGPLMPSGVPFQPYHPLIEDFQGPPNYVAALKTSRAHALLAKA
jgi:FkbM family methyltransferase